ncbi:MAG: peptidoglycan binding protein CsiV [Gammaproteobacteria bacterium]|nr:peptidoglycan binding protein CsiV [Gammaproteobacteria bacterium]MBU2479165.1 peptidoglycan binding protein CsiV [Gammaproteobacteria bacterium]
MSFKATTLFSLIIAASLALLPLTAIRAASQDYDVEIVVYASLSADDGAEQWPTPKAFPATEQALDLGEGGTRLLTGGARNLQAIADTMRRSSLYRPLLHWRWRQPGWERSQAKAIHVQIPAGSGLPLTEVAVGTSKFLLQQLKSNLDAGITGASGQPLLDGTLTLTRSRYLHMAVDLIYIDPNTGSALQLKESRRMRSGELHYLDQPRFGALVQVTPVVVAQ